MIAFMVGTILGLAGLGVSVFAILDNRRLRNEREKAVIAARATIERVYGLLIGIKPAVGTDVAAAINDGLSAINQQRKTLDAL
jgi:hypothetical protein